jgi:hypothetical protein
MNNKTIATVILVALIAAGTLVFAQQQAATPAKPAGDPRIDKLLEQNAQILKNQSDMDKKLDDIKEGLLQVRRRTS